MRFVVVYVSPIDRMRIDVDCNLTGQRTEANVSRSRHAYGLTVGLNKTCWEIFGDAQYENQG